MRKRKIDDGFEVAEVIALSVERLSEDTALTRLPINGIRKLVLAPCPTQS